MILPLYVFIIFFNFAAISASRFEVIINSSYGEQKSRI